MYLSCTWILKNQRQFNLHVDVVFVDFEKVFDRVNRNKLWSIMEHRGYPQHLINVIRNLYYNSKIIVNTGKIKTEEILLNKWVKQRRSILPTLFNNYIDDIIQAWRQDISSGIKLNQNTSLDISFSTHDRS